MHSIIMTFLPSLLLEYLFPQNVEAKIDTPVLTAVMVPIWVPLNPMELKYCPISGQSTPIGAYVKMYIILYFLLLFNCFTSFFRNSISKEITVHNINIEIKKIKVHGVSMDVQYPNNSIRRKTLLIVLIRTMLIYAVVLVAMRIMGKSELSKLSTFQMVILFMIAELASIPIDSPTSSLLNGITAIITLMFLQVLLSFLSMKSEGFKNFVNGKPSLLIDKGKINIKEMSRLRLTVNDLFQQLRIDGSPSLSDVDFAIMEDNGELSILSKNAQSRLPLIFVCDGAIYENNFKRTNITKEDLMAELNKSQLCLKDVFLAYLDSSSNLHIYKYPPKGDDFAQEVIQ